LVVTTLASGDKCTVSRHKHDFASLELEFAFKLVPLEARSLVIAINCENLLVTINCFAQSEFVEDLARAFISKVDHRVARVTVFLRICLNNEVCALESRIPLIP
jgi:hypothetical protein